MCQNDVQAFKLKTVNFGGNDRPISRNFPQIKAIHFGPKSIYKNKSESDPEKSKEFFCMSLVSFL